MAGRCLSAPPGSRSPALRIAIGRPLTECGEIVLNLKLPVWRRPMARLRTAQHSTGEERAPAFIPPPLTNPTLPCLHRAAEMTSIGGFHERPLRSHTQGRNNARLALEKAAEEGSLTSCAPLHLLSHHTR